MKVYTGLGYLALIQTLISYDNRTLEVPGRRRRNKAG
jgi:hypothetical protein